MIRTFLIIIPPAADVELTSNKEGFETPESSLTIATLGRTKTRRGMLIIIYH